MAKYNITFAVEVVDNDIDICGIEDEATAMLKEVEETKRYSHTFENFKVKNITKSRS